MKIAYAFDEVAVLANGVPLTGFGEGDDVIQIARRNDIFSMVVGAKGSGVPVRSSDRSAEVTLGLLQGHEDNAILAAMLAVDERGTFTGVNLLITILASGETVSGRGVITKPADRNMGANLNRYDWVFILENAEFIDAALPEAGAPQIPVIP